MTKVSHLLRALLLCAFVHAAFGQAPSQAAEEEAVRRQEKAILLRKTLEAAGAAQAQKDLQSAVKLYEDAWSLTEQLGSSVEAERAVTAKELSAVRLALAIQAQRAGDMREADVQVSRAIKVDPNNLVAKQFKADNDSRLADLQGKLPSEQALANVPAYRTNMVNAATMVQDGKLFYEMGKLDEAEAVLKHAVTIDPDNDGAFYYLSLIREARFGRSHRSRTVTSKDRLLEVEQAWERPVNSMPIGNPYATTNRIYTGAGRQAIQNKLDRIMLNEVKFEGLPLSEVVKFLDEQARARDPERKGINFIINSSIDTPQANAQPTVDATGQLIPAAPVEPIDLNSVVIRINPALRNVRLADAIDAISKVAERPLKITVEDYAVVFTQRLPEPQQLHTRQFRVDPNTFVQGLESVVGFPFGNITVGQGGAGGGGGGGGGAGGAGGQGLGIFSIPRVEVSGTTATGGAGGGGGGGVGGQTGSGITGVTRTNVMASVQVLVRQFFQAAGVDFPQTAFGGQGGFGGGGFAPQPQIGANGQPLAQGADQKALFFNDRVGILFVRATLSDLDIIEQAIQALNVAPPQVEIEAKFAEVSQTDSKALGFQWLLGNFLMGGGKVGAQGGTAPSFAGQASGANPSGVFPGPSAFLADGTEILSPGLTFPSGTDNNITAGLRNQDGNQSAIPTVGTITGILTDPQFRLVINALEQRDGVDLLSAPKVTTLSGRQAQVTVADVRSVVTGVNANQTAGGAGGGAAGAGGLGVGGGGAVGSTITYTVQAIPFGPVLDVIPYVSSDEYSIQMTIIPSYSEFIGYDDPGDFVPSVQSVGGSTVSIPVRASLPLPRLRARQVTTSAIVWDGQTIVLGGLISEDVKKQRDKVPVLGDIPVLGRLFRSESSLTLKKNLIIFVTPTIIDPSGKRVHDPNNLPFDPASTVPAGSVKP